MNPSLVPLAATLAARQAPGAPVRQYARPRADRAMATHNVVDHAGKYVDGNVHTNGMESVWWLLRRTLKGTYVSVEPFHRFRYLDEHAFRFNQRTGTDASRFVLALNGVLGKRLTYVALTGSELPRTCRNSQTARTPRSYTCQQIVAVWPRPAPRTSFTIRHRQ